MAVSTSPLGLEYIITTAKQRTGLDDFGGDSFRAPLKILLEALVEQADLNEAGTQGPVSYTHLRAHET